MHSPPSKTPLFLSLVRIGVILEPQYIFTPIEIACLSRAKKSFLILESFLILGQGDHTTLTSHFEPCTLHLQNIFFLSLGRTGVILEPRFIFTPIEIACLSRAKKSFLILGRVLERVRVGVSKEFPSVSINCLVCCFHKKKFPGTLEGF